MFVGLLTSILSFSNHIKCVSLSNQKCIIQFTLINIHPNEYSQELHYYPFAVNFDRCAGSCNTLNDLSNKVSVPNKSEDLNIHDVNMITGINVSNILTKDIYVNLNVNLMEENVIQIKSGIMINVDANVKEHHICAKKIIFIIMLYVVIIMLYVVVQMVNI